MTTFILLRHCHSIANQQAVLAGRTAGVGLSKIGIRQSQVIPKFLGELRIDRVISSPLERCIQSIEPYAQSIKRKIHKDPSFIEMDYGRWSGEKLKDLSKKAEWKQIQKAPSSFKFPGGESFISADRRVEKALRELSDQYPTETILIVSHGDIIKLAVRSCVGSDIDDFQRIVVDPASITVMVWEKKQRRLLHLNLPTKQRFRVSDLVSSSRTKKRSDLNSRTALGGGSNV